MRHITFWFTLICLISGIFFSVNPAFAQDGNDTSAYWRDSSGNRFSVDESHSIDRIWGGGWRVCKTGACAIFSPDKQQLSDYIFTKDNMIYPLSDNTIAVDQNWEDEKYLFDYQGNLLLGSTVTVFPVNNDVLWVKIPGKQGFLSSNGSFLKIAPDIIVASDWSRMNLHLAKTKKEIPPKYQMEDDVHLSKLYHYGWIDIYSGRSINADFDYVQYENHKILALRGDTTFVYNENNRLLHVLPHVYTGFFPNTGVSIYYQDRKGGLIDSTFNIITPPQFERLEATVWGGFIFRKDGKLGMIDQQGKEILPPVYDQIVPTESDRKTLNVVLNGKTGVVDFTGNRVFEPMYESVQSIGGNHFVIKREGKYNMVNRAGTAILPVVYDSIKILPYCHTMLVGHNGYFGMVDFNGGILLPVKFESLQADDPYERMIVGRENGLFGAWQMDGTNIFPAEYQEIERKGSFYQLRKNDRYGLCDYKGAIQIPIIYDTIWEGYWPQSFSARLGIDTVEWFEKDFSLVQITPKTPPNSSSSYVIPFKKNKKIGLYDSRNWQELQPPVFDQMQMLGRPNIYAVARRDTLVELLKKPDGTIVISFPADSFNYESGRFLRFWRRQTPYLFDLFHLKEYRLADPFDPQLLLIPESYPLLPFTIGEPFFAGPNKWIPLSDYANKKCGCYNPATGVLIPVIYDFFKPIDSLGFIMISRDRQCAILNPAGKAVSAFEFEYVYNGNRHCFVVRKNGKYGLYNKDTIAVKPLTSVFYDVITPDHDCFLTDINPKISMLDPEGRELLPPKFNYIQWVGDNRWVAWEHGTNVGVIKPDGSVVVPFTATWIGADYPYGFIVYKGKKAGLTDYNGKILLPFEYDQITAIKENPGTYCTLKNGVVGTFTR